jgi:hypothetical protein
LFETAGPPEKNHSNVAGSKGDDEVFNGTFNGWPSSSSNALALISYSAGGTESFSSNPSPPTILFFQSDSAAAVNVADEFSNGASLY